MPIEVDWEVSEAPSDDDDVSSRRGRTSAPALGRALQPTFTVDNVTQDSQQPDQPPAPSWRRVGLVAALVIAGLALAVFGINGITQHRWSQLSADIMALVQYEEDYSQRGQTELVLGVQDPDNADWLAVRTAQVRGNLAAAPPIPQLAAAEPLPNVGEVQLLDTDWIRVDVQRGYTTPNGQPLAFSLPQFYRRASDNDWLRTPPPGGFWGTWSNWQADLLHIHHSERDTELVAAIGPRVNEMLEASCQAWPDACAGLAPARLYLSGYVGSLDYDPLRNIQVMVTGSASQASDRPDYFVSIPSPQLAGIPANAASLDYLADYLAVRMIAELARQASESRVEADALISSAVARLSLTHANPGFATGDRFAVSIAGTSAQTGTRPSSRLEISTTLVEASPANTLVHTVVAGETLGGIAALYQVDIDSLIRVNHLPDPDHIIAGQPLIIWIDVGR